MIERKMHTKLYTSIKLRSSESLTYHDNAMNEFLMSFPYFFEDW